MCDVSDIALYARSGCYMFLLQICRYMFILVPNNQRYLNISFTHNHMNRSIEFWPRRKGKLTAFNNEINKSKMRAQTYKVNVSDDQLAKKIIFF